MSKAHLSKHHAFRFVITAFCLLMFCEGCAAYRIYITHRDVITALMVCIGWFKDSLHVVMDRILEDI